VHGLPKQVIRNETEIEGEYSPPETLWTLDQENQVPLKIPWSGACHIAQLLQAQGASSAT
jgi:hypothetical protein